LVHTRLRTHTRFTHRLLVVCKTATHTPHHTPFPHVPTFHTHYLHTAHTVPGFTHVWVLRLFYTRLPVTRAHSAPRRFYARTRAHARTTRAHARARVARRRPHAVQTLHVCTVHTLLPHHRTHNIPCTHLTVLHCHTSLVSAPPHCWVALHTATPTPSTHALPPFPHLHCCYAPLLPLPHCPTRSAAWVPALPGFATQFIWLVYSSSGCTRLHTHTHTGYTLHGLHVVATLVYTQVHTHTHTRFGFTRFTLVYTVHVPTHLAPHGLVRFDLLYTHVHTPLHWLVPVALQDFGYTRFYAHTHTPTHHTHTPWVTHTARTLLGLGWFTPHTHSWLGWLVWIGWELHPTTTHTPHTHTPHHTHTVTHGYLSSHVVLVGLRFTVGLVTHRGTVWFCRFIYPTFTAFTPFGLRGYAHTVYTHTRALHTRTRLHTTVVVAVWFTHYRIGAAFHGGDVAARMACRDDAVFLQLPHWITHSFSARFAGLPGLFGLHTVGSLRSWLRTVAHTQDRARRDFAEPLHARTALPLHAHCPCTHWTRTLRTAHAARAFCLRCTTHTHTRCTLWLVHTHTVHTVWFTHFGLVTVTHYHIGLLKELGLFGSPLRAVRIGLHVRLVYARTRRTTHTHTCALARVCTRTRYPHYTTRFTHGLRTYTGLLVARTHTPHTGLYTLCTFTHSWLTTLVRYTHHTWFTHHTTRTPHTFAHMRLHLRAAFGSFAVTVVHTHTHGCPTHVTVWFTPRFLPVGYTGCTTHFTHWVWFTHLWFTPHTHTHTVLPRFTWFAHTRYRLPVYYTHVGYTVGYVGWDCAHTRFSHTGLVYLVYTRGYTPGLRLHLGSPPHHTHFTARVTGWLPHTRLRTRFAHTAGLLHTRFTPGLRTHTRVHTVYTRTGTTHAAYYHTLPPRTVAGLRALVWLAQVVPLRTHRTHARCRFALLPHRATRYYARACTPPHATLGLRTLRFGLHTQAFGLVHTPHVHGVYTFGWFMVGLVPLGWFTHTPHILHRFGLHTHVPAHCTHYTQFGLHLVGCTLVYPTHTLLPHPTLGSRFRVTTFGLRHTVYGLVYTPHTGLHTHTLVGSLQFTRFTLAWFTVFTHTHWFRFLPHCSHTHLVFGYTVYTFTFTHTHI